MKRFRFIIPIMVVVLVLAILYLNKDHTEVPLSTRILIAIGGSIVSGVISYFLLKKEVHQIDPKPSANNLKKRP